MRRTEPSVRDKDFKDDRAEPQSLRLCFIILNMDCPTGLRGCLEDRAQSKNYGKYEEIPLIVGLGNIGPEYEKVPDTTRASWPPTRLWNPAAAHGNQAATATWPPCA